MPTYSLKSAIYFLLIAWLILGITASIAVVVGIVGWPLILLGALPPVALLIVVVPLTRAANTLTTAEKGLVLTLAGMLTIHATGLLIPEVGFDAVWYHLPVLQSIVNHRQLVFLPDLYQTANPLFSDVIFMPGFLLAREFGTKVTAFLLGLSLLLTVYQLARLGLSRKWALVTCILVASFQVFSWQVTSFYTDIPKALWELGALWLLLDSGVSNFSRRQLYSGFSFGASLASKAFSILLLPVMIVILMSSNFKLKNILSWFLAAMAIAAPWYLLTKLNTGQWWFSVDQHLIKLDEIGGQSSVINYVIERTLKLPWSIIEMTFVVKDYTTLLFLLVVPWLWYYSSPIWKSPLLRSLALFSAMQWLVWWYVPPLSTRYALSGFATLAIMAVWLCAQKIKNKPQWRWPIYLALMLAVAINMAPRLLVAARNLQQSTWDKQKAVEFYFDGSIDQHLKAWYQLP